MQRNGSICMKKPLKNKQTQKNVAQHFLNIPIINLPRDIFPYSRFNFQFSEAGYFKNFEVPNTILGKQAEAIFEHLLIHNDRYHLISANKQVQDHKITIGELDYLIKDLHTQKYYHIEVACKFYLFDPTIQGEYEGKWIGSNRKDTLLDKLNKLKTKQFPLLYRPELRAFLKEKEMDVTSFIQQHYIISSFYIPAHIPLNSLPLAYQECIVGTWIYFKDFVVNTDSVYATPSKKEWLLPHHLINFSLKHTDVLPVVAQSIAQKRSLQVYENCQGTIKKFFIVWW